MLLFGGLYVHGNGTFCTFRGIQYVLGHCDEFFVGVMLHDEPDEEFLVFIVEDGFFLFTLLMLALFQYSLEYADLQLLLNKVLAHEDPQ